jgi:hypothetical protein
VLIAVSAGIMFIGAAFMLIPGILPLLTAFTKTLAIFIIGTIGVYAVAGAMSMGTIKFAKDVKNLIITSTAIMFLGAIVLMKYPQIVPWCLGFTVLFAAFITGVTLPFKLIKDDVKTSVKSALIFAGLVSLSAAILLIGAHAIDNNFGNALLFTGALSIFIFALMGTF